MAKKLDDIKWTTIAWQGITVSVPEDWNIGAIGGEGSDGYLRIDSPDEPRMEIKWSKPAGNVDVKKIVDKYLSDISRSRKRNASEIEVKRDIKLGGKSRKRRSSIESFSWQAEVQGFGAAWYCKDCGRTIIVQVMGRKDEDAKALAERVLADLEDHSDGDNARWAIYGVDFAIPKDFQLEGQKLMSGLVELWYKRDTETIRVSRWGMANIALKNTELDDWIAKQNGKRLKVHRPASAEAEHAGHAALAITGGVLTPIQNIQRFVMHCRGKLFADRLRGVVWHCPEDNKIYYIETFVDRANENLHLQIAETITCHLATS